LRLAVYTDYTYKRHDGEVRAERAFALFIDALAERLGGLTLAGRLDPRPGAGPYRLGPAVTFVPLPFYETVTRPLSAGRQLLASMRHFWRVLDDVDTVWLLGPSPLALLFAAQTLLRRRALVLGVRQDTNAYVKSRHPHRRWIQLAGALMEGAWRALGRRAPVVVVGPQLARNYRRSRRLLEVAVSLVREQDLVADVPRRTLDGDVKVLSVGRLETEKNPLLLADVLARLNATGTRWQLTVIGEGPLREQLAQRLDELGVAEHADLRGYVPHDDGLTDAYRDSDLLLHVSWTEGLPQILFEAFAAGLPVVATDVGGIRAAVGDATELIPPGDADAAVQALERLRGDAARRERLAHDGLALARAHTLEAETGRLAAFVAGAGA
jgi:glycosyltransferase involved in cell wall biosynthesis